ncbi:hypothetical protein E2P81_ATG08475 [Venturia nashicola]|uniref:Uncharacterized protein n=1 Tax=Venturia nashicola TaxID=86259 RepID=A0A4Z1NGD6_9PEZI|nr:hypothetical protein E6O75_ATG08669 [Venturia nashicola]TLD20811.1 hypothetical protein E2P81_ATG08475 [Venturia nashicola]
MVASPPPGFSARRRSSSRRSSGAQLPAALNSTRGPMPRDDNAFCYQKEHIKKWLMPEGLYDTLQEDLQTRVKNLQQSGAAVMTSLERVEKMRKELPPSSIKEDDEPVCEQPVPLGEVNGKLYELQASRRASESGKEEYDCIPIPLEYRSFGSFSDTVFSSDYNTPDTNVTGCPSPMSLDHSTQPDSPAPLDIGQSRLSRQPSNSVAAPPDNQQTGQYWNQLVHLREQDVVRLRHSVRLVDIELNILKGSFGSRSPNSPPVSPAANVVIDPLQSSDMDIVFQEWWSEKKALAHSLVEKCGRIDPHIKPNLGWS